MSTTYVPAALRDLVAQQARHRCGYCLTAEEVVGSPMEIDHLIPEVQGGETVEENLWLACSACNTFKGGHSMGLDPQSGERVPLFKSRRQQSRRQQWRDHFVWTPRGDYIQGRTPVGRATIAALRLNRPLLVRARQLWTRIGVHPPGDTVVGPTNAHELPPQR